MGNLYDFLLNLLVALTCAGGNGWEELLSYYKVLVEEVDASKLPDYYTLGCYRPGKGRWGLHKIRILAGLPYETKITTLLHEFAHFVEYTQMKVKKHRRNEIESHNDEWKSIFRELLYDAYDSGFIDIQEMEEETRTYGYGKDLPIVAHVLGIPDFGMLDMYDYENEEYISALEINISEDSYDDEDINLNYY